MEFTGKIIEILSDNGISKDGRPWTRNTYVVMIDEEHHDVIHFGLMNERIPNNLNVNDMIKFNMSFRSRAYQSEGKPKRYMYNGIQWGDIVLLQ